MKQFILDLLFPIECLGCQKPDVWLCSDCLKKIKKIPQPTCPFCHEPTSLGKVCKKCQDNSYLGGVLINHSYEDELLKEAIHVFKYKYAHELKKPLGELLIKSFQNNVMKNPALKNTLIIPVPLHKKRLKQRGFNQAELLAEQVASSFQLPINKKGVTRKKYTESQANLNRQERLNNIQDSFVCLNPDKINNQDILIIDDVSTTASTLNECAKALKTAGAKSIWGLVIARDV